MKPSFRAVAQWFTELIEEAPEELAYCEFGCKDACLQDEWETCKNRLSYERWYQDVSTGRGTDQQTEKRAKSRRKGSPSLQDDRLNVLQKQIHELRQRLREKKRELKSLKRKLSEDGSGTAFERSND